MVKEIPGIDVEQALARMMGNEDLLRRMLGKFRDEFLGKADEIQSLLDTGDIKAAEAAAHVLKGVSGTIGASAVYAAAKALDDVLLSTPESPDVPHHVADLAAALDEIRISLETAL